MSVQNTLSFTLVQLDSLGNTMARRAFAVTDDVATVGEFRSGTLITTAEATIGLPILQPRQIMLRNTHSTAKILVKWTPFGGAEATVTTLGPGAAIALWDPTAAGTAIGISSLKLTADTANTTYEMFLGG